MGRKNKKNDEFALTRSDSPLQSYNQPKSTAMTAKSKFDYMMDDAVKGFRLTERAKAEIVHNQLVQFSEILKIKLRNRLYQYKFQAHQIWDSLIADGGQFFVPANVHNVNWEMGSADDAQTGTGARRTNPSSGTGSSSIDTLRQIGGAASFFVPSNTVGKLGFGVVSILTIGSLYRKLISDMRPVIIFFVSANMYNRAQLYMQAKELNYYLNAILAFEENGEDELESERIVREIAEQISIRHINHISKLSKNGQKVLASVIVDRIFRHLSRHRFGFQGESPIWYVSEMQQMMWSIEMFWKRLILPADRIATPQKRLSLHDRCIRALTAESSDNDDRVLELEPFHDHPDQQPMNDNPATVWTAASVLSKCGIFIHEENQMYTHSQTDLNLYGFAYGASYEVKWRKMRPLDPNTPTTSQQSPDDDDDDQENPNEPPIISHSKL